ncbi:MAG: DUF2284 domain-containing protein [Promethearchaeota archaeon]
MIASISRYEVTGKLAIDYRARYWCRKPYPDHQQGCPNYGKKKECPPQAPLIEDFLDLTKQHWFVVVIFDLIFHARKMKDKHPNWTEKQCRCVLYWQNTVRKELRTACDLFANRHPDELVYTLIPEAMGVHVIRTARLVGLPIKARPKDVIYKIALIGYTNNRRKKQLPKTYDILIYPDTM